MCHAKWPIVAAGCDMYRLDIYGERSRVTWFESRLRWHLRAAVARLQKCSCSTEGLRHLQINVDPSWSSCYICSDEPNDVTDSSLLDVTLCRWTSGSRRLGGSECLHFQSQAVLDCLTLKQRKCGWKQKRRKCMHSGRLKRRELRTQRHSVTSQKTDNLGVTQLWKPQISLRCNVHRSIRR